MTGLWGSLKLIRYCVIHLGCTLDKAANERFAVGCRVVTPIKIKVPGGGLRGRTRRGGLIGPRVGALRTTNMAAEQDGQKSSSCE
jgi:hypothetical protein